MGIFFKDKAKQDDNLSEDTRLAFKAADGDNKSFEILVRKYERLVSTCAYSVVGNSEDALDVSQEAFLKAYRSLSSFKGDSEFSTWLYRIAKNSALDFIRKKKEATVSIDSSGEESEGFDIADTDGKTNPEKAALENEKNKILYDAIYSLKDEHKEVLLLRDINGYSYDDIAAKLEIEEGTVKSRIFRAREALKKALIKENYF